MTVANLLNVTDGGQKIKIVDNNSLKTLYDGQVWCATYTDCEVVAIYTNGSTIVIGVI